MTQEQGTKQQTEPKGEQPSQTSGDPDQTKQAPGYDDTRQREDNDPGDVNQQDPAWRPGDDPVEKPTATDDPEEKGQGAGGF